MRIAKIAALAAGIGLGAIVVPAHASSVADRAREVEDNLQDAEQAMKNENWEVAITKLDAVIASRALKGPNLGVAHFQRGMAYYHLKRCADAMPDYDIAVELLPEDANPVSARGFCQAELGNEQGAIADFTATIALDEENLSALSNLCVIHYNGTRYAEAVPFCVKAAELAPDNASLLKAKAAALELAGDKAGALEAWKALLALTPDDKDAQDGVARNSTP